MAKRLKELVKAQELLMSKEWTINSFWIEDELNKYIKKDPIK